MKAASLLRAAREKQAAHAVAAVSALATGAIFEHGAVWMGEWMAYLHPEQTLVLTPLRRFSRYGLLKYSAALLGFGIACVALVRVHLFLLPGAILVFYAIEVHFLFLFPLLLENEKRPWLCSIRMTYQIGLLQAMVTVMWIGFFMLTGLLHRKDPLLNWHIGCLAVLIWFYEVRDRLSSQACSAGNTSQ